MDTHLLEFFRKVHDICHQVEGYLDAKEDLKPNLRLIVHDEKPKILYFPTQKSPAMGQQGEDIKQGIIEFTKQEISKMPKEKRNYFRLDGVRARWRKKPNGVFEIRCTIKGEQFYGASTDLQTAKKRFIESLYVDKKNDVEREVPKTFVKDYALHFLETFKKPNVGEVTYSNYVRITKLHIIKALGEKNVGDVSASNCQNLLSSLLEEGKGRTTEEVKNLLTWIFDGAVADHLIDVSPMRTVRVPKHRREIGKCMSKDVLAALIGEPKCRYDYVILLLAYTGLRPGEVKSAVFIDGFITVKNGKTPTNAPPSFRRFPLHTRLLPYVKQIEENVDVNMDEVSRHFRKKIKGYRLYDLRHTFTTYIQESGANEKWVDYVTNHVGAQNVTQKVYTHWTDDFQRKEMEKLRF